MTDTTLNDFLGDTQKRRLPGWAKWAIIAVVLLLLVLGLRACFGGTKAPNYATTPVRQGNMEVHVTATGNLEPINEVTVGSEISGLVKEVFVEENDRVVKGQALAQIDPEKLQDAVNRSKASLDSAEASVAQAQATAAQTKAQLDRQEEVARISGGKVPSKTELDTARADYRRALANVGVARASVANAAAQLSTDRTNMARGTIRSPVTGVILTREVEPGQTVAASFNTPTLFLIAEDLGQMQLEVKVDEADVGQVKDGQSANFTVDAYPGETFPAIIKRVNVGSNSSSASSSSSSTTTSTASSSGVVSYGALLTVNNPKLTLRPGMTATATIITAQEKNVLMVPNAALRFQPSAGAVQQQSGGSILPMPGPRFRPGGSTQEVTIGRGSRQTVYTLGEDGKLTPHEVTAGSTNGSETIVTGKTLKAGMTVVTGALAATK
jgi:HlyD family secretion protein